MNLRVIIAGSRTFSNYDLLKSKCDEIIGSYSNIDKIEIISGHANGADKLGERYSVDKGYSLEIMPAEWNKYGKSAGYKRNADMRKRASSTYGNSHGILIAFWDCKSNGTKDMINICKSDPNITVHVVLYDEMSSKV